MTHATSEVKVTGGKPRTQHALMRELVDLFGDDVDKIAPAYAFAEHAGLVRRNSNTHGLTAEDYARRLYRDACLRGWL